MDVTAVAVGITSVCLGYWVRGWQVPEKIDPPACNCICKIEPASVPAPANVGFPYLFCGLAVLIILVALLSNAALVLKFSFKDNRGTDRELQINVKGKSKGIYGGGRGLAITG